MAKTIIKIIIWVLVVLLLATSVWYFFIYRPTAASWVLKQYASLTYEHKQYIQSGKAYAKLAEYDSINTEDLLKAADAFEQAGNYTKAEYYLQLALDEHPDNLSCYMALCALFVREDKLLDAEDLLSSCAVPEIRTQLETLRPAAPQIQPEQTFSQESIPCSLSFADGSAYYSVTEEFPSTRQTVYTEPFLLSDGVTTVSAVVVGTNGLISPVSSKTFTVRGEIQELIVDDDKLNDYLHEVLGIDRHAAIYTNQVWDVKELNIPDGISDLSPLSSFLGLKRLTIENLTADLAPINDLPELEYLLLGNCSMVYSNYLTLSTLTSLQELHLSGCSISNTDFLSVLSKLRVLDLSNNNISDTSSFAALMDLEELYINGNKITSMASVAALQSLRVLNISGNSVYNLGALSSNSVLEELYASDCSLSDLAPLEGKNGLKVLDISKNSISDLSPLAGCTALETLDAGSNHLSNCSAVASLLSIRELNVSNNELSVCPQFPSNSKLLHLNLSGNTISDISNLKVLLKLTELNISSNKLTDITVLQYLPELVSVTAYFNVIDDSIETLEARSILVYYTKGYEFAPEELSLDDFGTPHEKNNSDNSSPDEEDNSSDDQDDASLDE